MAKFTDGVLVGFLGLFLFILFGCWAYTHSQKDDKAYLDYVACHHWSAKAALDKSACDVFLQDFDPSDFPAVLVAD